jgi:hypothetical protein
MGKRVTKAREKVMARKFQMDRYVRRVGTDDGSTYVFERPTDSSLWSFVRRYDCGGDVSNDPPSRLPKAVEAHMRGHIERRAVLADEETRLSL